MSYNESTLVYYLDKKNIYINKVTLSRGQMSVQNIGI